MASVILLAACGGSSSTADLPPGDDTVVERYTDGDTLWVEDHVKIRLIGIDTPETQDPVEAVECFATEAAAFLEELLPLGTEVRVEYDVERLDQYERTLAYIYRASDGLFVNAEMVRKGYAQAYTVPPNVAHVDEFVALQREARDAGRGLWGSCDVPTQPATAGPGTAECDASYPDACIPPPPPDLDCADVVERAFRVEGGDPHRFDSDGNGIGCER
ncbi:MAG: thermonuclease family protein [Actinomycetota bacterium]